MCNILLFSCSISPFFNKIPFALLFFCACNSMIYSFCLLGIYVLLVLLKLLILNMFRICLLGVYVLSFLSQFLYLNMFCISLWGIYFLWFSLFALPFSFSSFIFYCYLLVYLLLSACVSFLICLYFYCYLLVFLWYFAACTSAGIQRVLRPSYSSYHSRHTMCTTAVVHSPKAHTLCTISP